MKFQKSEEILIEEFVIANWAIQTNGQMAKALGISIATVRRIAHAKRLLRMEMEYWTDEQVEFLKKKYKTIGDKELAMIYNQKWQKAKGWSFKHIEKKRLYLKLNRTSDQLAEIKKRNVKRGCYHDMGTWKTRGAAKDGTIKIWMHRDQKTGKESTYVVIKVKGKYVHAARYRYEQAFGKMKPGFVIGFKDRNNLNIELDNLESISRGEHVRRNGRTQKYSAELKELLKYINQLNHLLNNNNATK